MSDGERLDTVTPDVRSKMMAAVRQKDTVPEMAVRKLARSAGLAYRVRNRDLPGSPDLANRRRRWAVFVNGCFWHGHKNCPKTKSGSEVRVPKTNGEFWREKLEANRRRDAVSVRALRNLGFRVLLVWECQMMDPASTFERLCALPGSATRAAGE